MGRFIENYNNNSTSINYYAQWTDFNLVAGDNVFDITDLSASISNWKSGYVAISAEMLANSVTVNETPNNIGYSIKIVSDTQFIVNAVAPITATITVQSVLKKAGISYNFDLEMNWSILRNSAGSISPVTNQATFIQWLTNGYDAVQENQNTLTNIVVTDFLMTGNRIQCNLTADGTTLTLCGNTVVNADKIGITNGLVSLYLYSNQIVTFNPTISLPSSLQTLGLEKNQMTTASYTAMETWANAQPSFTNTCNVNFSNNIDSVLGTNLETILISKNCNVIA